VAELTHFQDGRPRMVDVSDKKPTARTARAEATVRLTPEAAAALKKGGAGKGDPLVVAQLAGIMAAKKTSELIPLCHPLPLSKVSVDIRFDEDAALVHVVTEAKTTAETGVEMEALTAASVAALTIYDMLKGASKGLEIENVRLLYKSGGKSGTWERG